MLLLELIPGATINNNNHSVNNKSSATAEDGRPYESSYDFVYIGVA